MLARIALRAWVAVLITFAGWIDAERAPGVQDAHS